MTFEDFLNEWHNKEEFITAFTSGSTGEPKEIKLPKDLVKASAERTINFFDITNKSHLHSCVSPDFIGGKMMAVRALLSGATLSWETPSNTPLKEFITNENIDLLAVVPSQMIHLVENINKLPEIKNIIIGGAPIHPDLKKKIILSGLNAFETYGMTETASHIALRKVLDKDIPFTILPGIQISKDENNCLIIRVDDNDEIVTNDIVDLISEKEFFIKGRKDDVLITGGKKINPVEIEDKIAEFIPLPYLVTGFPDEKWGEKVVLIIQKNPIDFDIKELKTNLGNVLYNWEMPKEILFVKFLPKTSNDKIRRVKDPSLLSFFEPGNNPSVEGQNMPG